MTIIKKYFRKKEIKKQIGEKIADIMRFKKAQEDADAVENKKCQCDPIIELLRRQKAELEDEYMML